MSQLIGLITILVDNSDDGIAFFCGKLQFELIEDTPIESDKRWVVVAPAGNRGTRLLLAQPGDAQQRERIGQQTGGRVGFFLYTDNFARDYEHFKNQGIRFVRAPSTSEYGTVAVFEDCSGNQWDLLEPTALNTTAKNL